MKRKENSTSRKSKRGPTGIKLEDSQVKSIRGLATTLIGWTTVKQLMDELEARGKLLNADVKWKADFDKILRLSKAGRIRMQPHHKEVLRRTLRDGLCQKLKKTDDQLDSHTARLSASNSLLHSVLDLINGPSHAESPTQIQESGIVPFVTQAVAEALTRVGLLRSQPDQSKADILKSMIERYSEAEIIKARADFWRHIGEQSKHRGVMDIQEVLAAGKMPPGLPLENGHLVELARSFRNKPSKLCGAQLPLWELACQIYPWQEIERSPIGMFGTEFDVARRTLANFWKDNVKKAEIEGLDIVADIAERFDAAERLVYMLSWLESPLVLRTGDNGKGKVGLFKLGRWFQDHAAR